ncbi:hypothetical protein OSB04_009133 [Centaurea solstitialis]|uniref:Uncharacterized protein n=1 Tax=Centaurea solstitialis TaxID=347529 RepID=A0AA38TVL4_9ASTR|nr:hypothetical protein OSB04_009133 [Centaurea solstitialis]
MLEPPFYSWRHQILCHDVACGTWNKESHQHKHTTIASHGQLTMSSTNETNLNILDKDDPDSKHVTTVNSN